MQGYESTACIWLDTWLFWAVVNSFSITFWLKTKMGQNFSLSGVTETSLGMLWNFFNCCSSLYIKWRWEGELNRINMSALSTCFILSVLLSLQGKECCRIYKYVSISMLPYMYRCTCTYIHIHAWKTMKIKDDSLQLFYRFYRNIKVSDVDEYI